MAKGKYEKWLEPDGLLLLEAWARDGLTDDDISVKMGINRATLYDWKKKYPDISDALKRGKEVVDVVVENALLKRALGYCYTEDKYLVVDMPEDEYQQKQVAFVNEYKFNHPEASQEELDRVRVNFPKTKKVLVEQKTKEVVPDTTAQIFWLKNRRPETWRDRKEVKVDQETNYNLTNEQLDIEIRRLEKVLGYGKE